jgi:hypothetical protein
MGGFDLLRGMAAAGLIAGAVPFPSQAQQRIGRPAPTISIYTVGNIHGASEVTPHVRLTEDANVLVIERGPNGEIRVLFPESPERPATIVGGAPFELPSFFSGFDSHQRIGQTRYVASGGTVIGLASRAPFNFEPISSGSEWNIDAIRGLIQGLGPGLARSALARRLGAKDEPIGLASMWFGADHPGYPVAGTFSDGVQPRD